MSRANRFNLRLGLGVAFVVCVGLAGAADAAYIDAVNALGPQAYWRLGDSGDGIGNQATDETGNHHGTYLEGVALGQPGAIFGDSDTSAHFDEVDDYVEIPDFNYSSGSGEFSVAFWLKKDGLPGPDFQYFFSHNVWNDPQSLNIYFREEGRDEPGAISLNLNATALPHVPAGFADGQWHFLAFTVSNADGAKLYVDGNVEAADPALGTDPGFTYDPPGSINLGRRVDASATRYYGSADISDGLLDEAVVFDFALSGSQVNELYMAGVPEPSTVVMSLLALGALGLYRGMRRRHRLIVGG